MATKKTASKPKQKTIVKAAVSKTTVAKEKPSERVAAIESAVSAPLINVSSVRKSLQIVARPMLAEFIGTFLLTCIVFATKGEPLYVMFALIGLVLMTGSISGAHLNPAITIGSWITKNTSGKKAVAYIIAQILGSLASLLAMSALIVKTTSSSSSYYASSSASNTLFQAYSLPNNQQWHVFFAELLGTAILAFAAAIALKHIKKQDRTRSALTYGIGIFIALTVAVYGVTYAISATTILNPSIAIALGTINWSTFWSGTTLWPIAVYFFAPILGGVIGFILEDFLYKDIEK